MVRLKDIAQHAGVSIMTVSKALRGARDISHGTKIRIQALARQMGYVPDSHARGLRTRSTRLLGLIIPAVTHPVLARVVLAIEEAAHREGYELILSQTMNLPEKEEASIRRLISRRVEGLFIVPVYRLAPSGGVYEELARCGIPTVILGHHAPFCSQFPCIDTDDAQGMELATRHLYDLGHRRIAFLAGPQTSVWAQERMEGYRRALRDLGLDWRDDLVFGAGATIEEGEKAALQMLQESIDATAVIGVSDQVAIGAASVFLDQGIQIPEQLSVVGFGNILLSGLFRVPLTTVHLPKLRVGVAAFESLRKQMNGDGPVDSRRLPVELVMRRSTGAAPAAKGSIGLKPSRGQ